MSGRLLVTTTAATAAAVSSIQQAQSLPTNLVKQESLAKQETVKEEATEIENGVSCEVINAGQHQQAALIEGDCLRICVWNAIVKC